ncbi:MAG: ATP-binding protein [Verrucomicrobiota bacterium]|nr:ATP-binding protein [Verrucomicrobiota bacterium]
MTETANVRKHRKSFTRVTLAFLLLTVALNLLTYLYWRLDLSPKIRAEVAAQASLLAEAQAPLLVQALAGSEHASTALEAAAARILLLTRPGLGDPLFLGLKCEADYEGPATTRILIERTWGKWEPKSVFTTEVPLYSPLDNGLIGMATFYSSDHLARHISGDFQRSLIGQAVVGSILLIIVWYTLLRLYHQMEAAREKAEHANAAKSNFLANMSHELRTPLNAIIGFTELMERDNALGEQDRKNLHIISRSGEHLLRLINSVLEMTKIEAGMTQLEISAFDFNALIESIDSMMGLKADQKGIYLRFTYATPVPRYIRADEGKLRQILINLVENAVKYTDHGGVTIAIHGDESEAGDGAAAAPLGIRFEIRDTGPGIAESEQAQLFVAFRQTRDGSTKKGGTGLGLAISRQYARLMGGDLTLHSKRGEGTVFTLTVKAEASTDAKVDSPLADLRRAIAVKGEAPEGGAFRIMVVDDMEENRLLLRKTLEPLGFALMEASDGHEAIALTHSWKPHLVWMDLRMPNCNGYDAMKLIREQLGPAKPPSSPVIVALTAHAFEEEKKLAIERGFDDFVRKPFKEHLLLETLHLHLGVEYNYQTADNAAPASKREKGKADTLRMRACASALPASIRDAILVAIDEGDLERIDQIIVEITALNTELGLHLKTLARDIAMDSMQKLFGRNSS